VNLSKDKVQYLPDNLCTQLSLTSSIIYGPVVGNLSPSPKEYISSCLIHTVDVNYLVNIVAYQKHIGMGKYNCLTRMTKTEI